MTGSSFFDYIHQQDHAELAELLGIHSTTGSNHHHHHSIHSSSSSLHLHHSSSASSPLPPPSVGSNASSDSESGHYHSPHSIMTASGPNDTLERIFCIRMKSTLTKRGCQHFKSSGYRVVHVVSHLRPEPSHLSQRQRSESNGSYVSNVPKIMGLVGVAIALPPPSVNELRLEPDMFVTRLGLDFKILHVEPR